MAVTRVCALALLGVASGMNIVNPATGKCLDLAAPCEGGGNKSGCKRVAAKKLKKGTNLQLFRCHDKENQQFEVLDSGRIRNPLTGLCIDIQAPCKDGSDKPDCDRIHVTEIEHMANVQLWTCHKDTGKLSQSYGNQLWGIKSTGQLHNKGSGLCLDVFAHKKKGEKRAAAKELGDEANMQVYDCHAKGNQIFDLETGKLASKTDVVKKFSVVSDNGKFLHMHGANPTHANMALALAGAGSLVVAAFVGVRARRSYDMSPSE